MPLREDVFGVPIIDTFRNEYHFLSNFYLGIPLVWKGIKFSSAEHAYQWAKTLDPNEQELILFQLVQKDSHDSITHVAQMKVDEKGNKLYVRIGPTTPGQAKRRGEEATLREDWDRIEVMLVMLEILREKFTQDWGLRQQLLNTGDAILIEGNSWHDNFWGSCFCKTCSNKGENILGKLLMRIREEFRNKIYCLGCPVRPDDTFCR